eukprot:3784696-Amphidinium_carterae.1
MCSGTDFKSLAHLKAPQCWSIVREVLCSDFVEATCWHTCLERNKEGQPLVGTHVLKGKGKTGRDTAHA